MSERLEGEPEYPGEGGREGGECECGDRPLVLVSHSQTHHPREGGREGGREGRRTYSPPMVLPQATGAHPTEGEGSAGELNKGVIQADAARGDLIHEIVAHVPKGRREGGREGGRNELER
jgi:hypothetical protein